MRTCFFFRVFLLCVLCDSVVSSSLHAGEPLATYRSNSQRTGSDGLPGPASPKVLWSWKSNDHFIATPVAHKDQLFVSGLGGFNVPVLTCLNIEPTAANRVAWTKSTPYLKLPTVSSPAIHDGRLIFGDGMHQTDGAILHCLQLDKGRMLWQYLIPGNLVHLEGSPTIAGSRVYLGGGAAGVVCVNLDRVTLDGKEMGLPAIQKLLEKKWMELQAKYEEDKKKNADLAVPPSEDDLPKPSPVLAWQQGKEKWHVDAPVAVAGERVLVASAFLDKEKAGDRALFCLNAKTGDIIWRTPLSSNPWGGPSLSRDLVVVSGSTIGYDPKQLKKARGSLAAYNLADGKEKWRKTVPGGIVSCVALTKDLAIAAATDGKVRAFDLRTGERRWIYDGKTPFFAPVALSAGVAYAGDLRGVVHAINLADGAPKWKLDLAADPVKAPGMIYGGPILHKGRLFVATCNLEGPNVRHPTVVVCIGDK
ncbi:MAG TPA: PQQ-binding-like beta-propeller repeat protein [Gemmataceae bacterium]|nr:PQQ-binding-like beta-propeller repeat protein [Gemmataceae bacterium]